ncbi:hypothetical protein [Alicyclobacillus shizuokensis]|uniref:hypothetical protein n=1 Tax=Alicyclobacillus shizuokensis TaxID=392014 RepID=UPI000830FB1B|nr:hypothetical protein [Alicyclobacillus shizuokensis]
MSRVLERLLMEDLHAWDKLVADYEERNRKLVVPMENTTETLHIFNIQLSELYTQVYYDFARAKRNRDAIQRFLESVLKDYYSGPNPDARRAGGIQFAREYPAPEFWPFPKVNLFEIEDIWNKYYYLLDATIATLKMKAESKITNNSILRLEKQLV